MAKKKWVDEAPAVDEAADEALVVEKVAEEVVEKAPTAASAAAGEKVLISIDNSVDDVVGLDQAGKVLVFDDEPGRFLKLPGEVVRALEARNKDRYTLAFGSYQLRLQDAEDEIPELDIKVDGRYARATSKLDVFNKKPGVHYCWKRPDELQQCVRDGYKVSKDGDLRTLVGSPSSIHRVAALGEDELILMEISEAGFARIDAAQKEQSARLDGSVEAQAKREISAIGPVYDPKEGDEKRYRFTAPADPEGRPISKP